MIKEICDICHQNEPYHKYKVKKLKSVVRSDMHVLRWVRIDICDACYNRLVRMSREDNNQ